MASASGSSSVASVPPCLSEDTLAAFCAGGLAAGELAAAEAHMDVCPRCAVAAAAGLGAAPAATDARSLSPLTFRPGQLVAGRYEIRRFIARGGMGEVYEAEDRLLKARVALKTVALADSNDRRAIERLGREVRVARRVTHPNVCRVFDLETSGEGVFVTMELLDGRSLGARIREEGALPAAEVASLLPAIVGGLAAAHGAGIVHRDLKSDNVMLCDLARQPGRRACVMDFGLARAVATEATVTTLSTDAGDQAGSVAYMAPEQVRGERSIGPAADVYALGVVLFEALTGRLPFLGANATETATLRLVSPPPRLDAFVTGLPDQAAWEEIIAGCLAVDPSRRFARVEDVLARLAGVAPVTPPRPGARRLVIAAVSLTALAALAGLWRWLVG